MKLSKRLAQISDLVTTPYDDIWDCCCDHGLLGFNLLAKNIATNVHFVDRVKQLTNNVEQVLLQHSSGNNWQIHCVDMLTTQLPLTNNHKQLVIIAGVGGDLLCEMVTKVLSDYQNMTNNQNTLEFIVCPIHHVYQVRECLNALSLNLCNEKIVYENKRFYEVLHLRYCPAPQLVSRTERGITLIGDKQWEPSNKDHQKYLHTLLTHYKNKLKSDRSFEQEKLEHIIQAYTSLLPRFIR